MRAASDRLCREYELSVIEEPKGKGVKPYLYKLEQAGMPTRYSVARAALDDAVSRSLTVEELSFELKQMGYKLQCNPNRKYWTITLPGWEKPIRIHKLGDDYGKDRIIERLYENDSSIRQDKFLSAYNKRGSRYKLPTRADKIRKKSGFQRRYLRCLYELGYLPKYKQSPAKVHSIFKDELMKCDMYSREARLLCDNNIVTEQDLFRYEKSIEGRMFSLTAVRAELRKEAKRSISEEQRENVKDKISNLTADLRTLRSEKKLCEDIRDRSGMLEEKLAAIDRERGREVREK